MIIIIKLTCCLVDFAVTANHRAKIKESNKGTKKDMEHKCEVYNNCSWLAWNGF